MADFRVLSDAAIGLDRDLLGFARYIDPLLNVLTDPAADTPFTIGVFGAWGSGKSSLITILDERLARDHPEAFVRVHFNPWFHRSESNMLVPLLHTLHDTLDKDMGHRFEESAKKIGNVLLRLGADVILKKLTADAASLKSLEELEANYVKLRGKVESEIRRLRTTLQEEADHIQASGARIIFFIDDLDRCTPDQIIDVLEAVKLFLDIRHVFIVLAVDKEVIDRGIEVRYNKFPFAEGRATAMGGEYLEKMVQLPLYLFPLDRGQVRGFMERLNPAPTVLGQLDLLQSLVVPNPRKIKRTLNILTVTSAIKEITPGLQALRMDVITRLVVLQVQSSDLYGEVVRQPDLLIALELAYAQKLRLDHEEDFLRFGSRRESIRALTGKYYRPESYLAALFSGSGFEMENERLPLYLTMLGGWKDGE